MSNFNIRRFMRKIPVSRRIVLLVLLGSVVPILIANFFAYSQARSAAIKTAMEYNVQMMGLIKQNLGLSSERGRDFIDELLVDPLIKSALRDFAFLDDSEKNKMIRDISKSVRSNASMLEYTEDTRLVTLDNTQIYSLSHSYTHPSVLDAHFRRIRSSRKNELWYFSEKKGRPIINLSRKIIHIGTLEAQGYLMLNINTALIENKRSRLVGDDRMQLMLIDSFGSTFYYGGENKTLLDRDVIDSLSREANNGSVARYEGDKELFICYFRDPDLDWIVVSYIPFIDLYLSSERLLRTTVLIAALLLGICLIISHIIIRSITQPLNAMVRSVSRASMVKFDTPLVDEANDELGFMAKAYNRVVLEVQTLLSQVEDEQNEKRKAEVKMLQAQITPHFLFNTLDSLRFTAVMSNALSVSDGLSALSHLLRNSIVSSEAIISLEQEVKNIRDYLTIQTIRHGSCIDFTPRLSDEVGEAGIMKLLLQPIVENSVIHGLKDDDSEICITLEASLQDGFIVIVISDDGTGFDPELKIDRRTNRFKNSGLSGIGLENVKERLALQYGESQSFSLKSSPGEGTTVRISYKKDEPEGAPNV